MDVIRAFEAFVDDLSNWYIRRSRRRFWDGDAAALHVLWFALVQSLRVVAPVMPFLTEHLWQALVRDVDGEPPDSVYLAGWPEAPAPTTTLLAEVAEVRRVVELGRQARASAGVRSSPAAAPPRRRGRAARGAATPTRSREELRVKEVEFGHVEATELRVKPNLPVLGPKLGKELGAVRAALAGGRVRAARRRRLPRRRPRARRGRGARRALAASEGWAVAVGRTA